tara:strand:+ start:656 stop:1141 length:486 start_codon:yes stop_codon:yes gene_type:complete
MIKKINLIFLTFFMIGKIKYAPGTFASIFACILFYLLAMFFSFSTILMIVLILFIYSFFAINHSFEKFDSDDPQEIVIDEVIGQMLTLLAIPIYETLWPSSVLYYYIFSLILFRLFDIWKPYPINIVDDNVKGPLGIMLDDIVASFYSILLLTIIFFFLGG